jgi:hypothetical protein
MLLQGNGPCEGKWAMENHKTTVVSGSRDGSVDALPTSIVKYPAQKLTGFRIEISFLFVPVKI